MKVRRENISIFMGDDARTVNGKGTEDKASKNTKAAKGTFFAGDFGAKTDKVEQKRKQAREKAMKVITDTFNGAMKVDADIDAERQRAAELTEEMGNAGKELKKLEDMKAELREAMGLDEESAKKNPEYMARADEIDRDGDVYREIIDKSENELIKSNLTVEAMKVEKLKSAPMIEAQETADDIMEEAGKEIVGMLLDDAKEHVEEEQEKEWEEAKKKAEEEQKKQEKLEEKKEEQRITEEQLDMIKDSNDIAEVQKKIKSIMSEMNVSIEDIKGAIVDKSV